MGVRLTKALKHTLRELADIEAANSFYWWRQASCARLAELGLAETYTPPSFAGRPMLKQRPYHITEAGRKALQEAASDD